MHNDTCFGSFLYSVGTQHWNLYQSCVTTSRVTYFTLGADTGTCISVTTCRGPILLWGPTQEPAPVMCDNEQGDLFYSAGRHRNLHQCDNEQSDLFYSAG